MLCSVSVNRLHSGFRNWSHRRFTQELLHTIPLTPDGRPWTIERLFPNGQKLFGVLYDCRVAIGMLKLMSPTQFTLWVRAVRDTNYANGYATWRLLKVYLCDANITIEGVTDVHP